MIKKGYSLTLLTHSLTHLLTHSLTHSLTHLLTHSRNIFITYWDSSTRASVGGNTGNIAISTEWKEHIEGLHLRIITLKDIQFSLIAYLTSTEASKVISDTNVIIMLLAFFFDAVEVDLLSLTHPLLLTLTYSLTHSPTHSLLLTHSLTYSLTHSSYRI